MKLLLLLAFCVCSACAFTQVPKKINPYLFELPDTVRKFKGNENACQELRDYWPRKQTQNNSSAGKYGRVVILPQDHMPCLVPDTNGLAKMPNAWRGVTVPYAAPYHPIPNPGLPKVQLFKNSSPGIPSK